MILMALIILLAAGGGNPLDPPEISPAVLTVLLGVGGLLGAGILVLTFVKLCKDVFGKRAAATLNIQAHSDSDPKDKDQPPRNAAVIDVTGFVATKDFEMHKEEARVRAVGLELQISQLRHDWKEEMGSFAVNAKDREEAAGESLDAINTKMGANGERLAKVETSAELILRILSNLEAKVDRNNERRSATA